LTQKNQTKSSYIAELCVQFGKRTKMGSYGLNQQTTHGCVATHVGNKSIFERRKVPDFLLHFVVLIIELLEASHY
jgi:hypothetical protein